MSPISDRHVDPSLRAAISAQIAKDYGEHTIIPGNKIPPVQRLLSRSPAINYLTGGGYPFGMITRFWGGFSSSKTTELFNIFAVAQALGCSCMYVNTEGVFDERLAKSCGVSLKEGDFELVLSRRIEDIGDIVQKALAGYHIVGVDSTTGTMSIEELAGSKGEVKTVHDESNTVGMTRARKWGYNMDWWQDRMNPENLIVITSQIQSIIGMTAHQRMAGEKAPGGEKLNHESAVVLHFMKGKSLKRRPDGGLEEIGEKGGEKGAFGRSQAAGGEIVIRCDKNKTGVQGRHVLLHHDKSIANFDPIFELEKFAKYYKIASGGAGGWWNLPDGSKVQSLRKAIEENPEFTRSINETVMRCAQDPEYERQLLRSRGGPGELMLVEAA